MEDADSLDEFIASDAEEEPSVVDGSDADNDEGGFEPVRVAGKARQSRGRQLGPPIRHDHRTQGLSEIHQHIIEDFIVRGREKCNQVSFAESAR